jgi:excisionase family DNA binding protein
MLAIESLLSTKEVATALGVSDKTVSKLFRSGKLDAFQLDAGGSPRIWRTTPDAVRRYIQARVKASSVLLVAKS